MKKILYKLPNFKEIKMKKILYKLILVCKKSILLYKLKIILLYKLVLVYNIFEHYSFLYFYYTTKFLLLKKFF